MYDLIIIGGSAAATTAGIYAARRGIKFVILTKEFGGEVATSGEIGNWPGVIKTDGLALAEQFKEHLKSYQVDIQEGIEVTGIKKQPDGSFCIMTGSDQCAYTAKTVIVATGVHPRELNVPGEKEFRTKGVSYCTVCDGPVFVGKTTAVIGGGNSALEAALMLADLCPKVYVINKNQAFKGEQVLIENLKKKNNVEIIYGAMTTEFFGDTFAKGLRYKDQAGAVQEIQAEGMFVHIGQIPNSALVPAEVVKTQFGEIKVNANCETSVPGLYAAGDVTDVAHKQIVIAAGQGCIAVLSAVQYLNKSR